MAASVINIDPAGANNAVDYTALDDGVEFNVPTLELKADGGIQEIAAEAVKYGDQSRKEVR